MIGAYINPALLSILLLSSITFFQGNFETKTGSLHLSRTDESDFYLMRIVLLLEVLRN
jgi:hypothetical protein